MVKDGNDQRPESKPAVRRESTQPVVPAMHGRYGGMLRRVFEALFGPIHYSLENAKRVRELADRGVIIYAARSPSLLLALYFNHALHRLGLPLARFVGGVNLFLWQPLGRLVQLLRRPVQLSAGPWQSRYTDRVPSRSEALLATVVNRGQSAFLFLPPPRAPGRWRRLRPSRHDYLRTLIAVQRTSPRAIILVPHVLTARGMGGTSDTLAARIFGDLRSPGRLRRLAMMLSTYRHATVRVGDAIHLRDFIAGSPESDDEILARKLQHELNRRMTEEERVVAGPVVPTPTAIARHVIRAPNLRAVMEQQAAEKHETPRAIEAKVRRYVSEIAAKYNPDMVSLAYGFMRWVFNRIYDGILVDEEGLVRAIEASRKGPLVFCPSHRSHVDYLVLSYVLWQHGVAPPHIAAGANLAFFPLGSLFRRAGAFFLRRSFRDNPLYAATFRAYVQEIIKAGTSIEVFLEGTRSRTGKLLMPRLGFLRMLVDSWRQGAREDVIFVPVSIDYERIIEARAYERELQGGRKKPENLKELLRATKVLRSRFGRVHLEFGNPISLATAAATAGLSQTPTVDASLVSSASSEPAWRQLTERLGHRILHEVAMACSVTPTSVVAAALLGHRARGMAEQELLTRGGEIIDFLDEQAARLAEPLQDREHRSAALVEAAHKLSEDGLLQLERAGQHDTEPIYRVPEEKRIALDYHKNPLMNYFAPVAMIGRAICKRNIDTLAYRDLFADAQFLSRLFRKEFLFRADAGFDTHFDDALASLAIRGYLDVNEDGSILVRAFAPLKALGALLDTFVEAYWITTVATEELKSFPLWERELQARALEHARRAFLEGRISRPEAINRTLIENAVSWLIASDVICEGTSGRRKTLKLAEAYSAERLDALAGDIKAFLVVV